MHPPQLDLLISLLGLITVAPSLVLARPVPTVPAASLLAQKESDQLRLSIHGGHDDSNDGLPGSWPTVAITRTSAIIIVDPASVPANDDDTDSSSDQEEDEHNDDNTPFEDEEENLDSLLDELDLDAARRLLAYQQCTSVAMWLAASLGDTSQSPLQLDHRCDVASQALPFLSAAGRMWYAAGERCVFRQVIMIEAEEDGTVGTRELPSQDQPSRRRSPAAAVSRAEELCFVERTGVESQSKTGGKGRDGWTLSKRDLELIEARWKCDSMKSSQ